MKTFSRLNPPLWLIAPGVATILTTAMLVLSAQTSLATNYTWDLNPGDPNGCGIQGEGNWICVDNWMPAGWPGSGVGDTATFGVSNVTNVSTVSSYHPGFVVGGIVFDAGASAFTITCQAVGISGTGIINNSGITQNFVGGVGFSNNASAGSNTIFTNNYGGGVGFGNTSTAGSVTIINGNTYGGYCGFPCGGLTEFDNTSTAGSATITNNGTRFSDGNGGGRTYFGGAQPTGEAPTAGGATIINNGTTVTAAVDDGGQTIFGYYNYPCNATAGSATIINNGATISGGVGGETHFFKTTTAGSATLIANGGTGGGEGGAIFFEDSSTGGMARVKIFGNGNLDISVRDAPDITIGSIEGDGNVFLGSNNLTVGANNLSTIFSGIIQDDTSGGSFTKIGSGILTFQGRPTNDYIADTVSLSVISGSIINLNFTGTPDAIGFLFVNGVPQTQGVYGGSTSGAPHQLPEFGGTGTVQVTMGPIPTPAVTTNPATNVASSLATLNGTVNPNGLPTSVYFEYGTTTNYTSSTPSQSYTGNTTQSVSANISGLSPNATYHFRLVGTNDGGNSYGSDRTFTTLSATGPPVVTTNPATNVASFSATLNGSLDPHGLITTVYFQYGTTTSYGLTTAPQNQSGNTFRSISANISGLSANTVYHFRVVASNSAGTRYGGDRTFTTLTATGPPVATTNPATLIASFSATLNGLLNPHGLTTTVYFQYGTTTSYGSTTSTQSQTGNTDRNVSANISGLMASHVYHFRIVATNSAGTTFGGDRTFTTLSVTGTPVVITNPASFVASFSATLNGSLDPHGLTTSIHFQYGTTTSYGLTTAPQSRAGNTYLNVSANISSLTVSTVYHFRIVATNSGGTTYGSDRTFTTLTATGAPVVTTSPATNVAISSATLNGSLDPHGLTTSVNFQYGTTTSYGRTTSMQSQAGNTYRNITADTSGLTTHTTYHFRMAATNSAGTRYGADRTFSTP